ncbi:hypothetical protein Q9189_004227 [Teloschistes chrysophthalmus]
MVMVQFIHIDSIYKDSCNDDTTRFRRITFDCFHPSDPYPDNIGRGSRDYHFASAFANTIYLVHTNVFTILGPFIGATVAVLLFVLTFRHQRRKKASAAGQMGRHGMPDSEAGIDEQQSAANATTYGNGNAVAGTHIKSRSDHHRGHRNRYYNSVYIGFKPEDNDNAGAVTQPPIAMRHIGRHGGAESGTVSSDSASVITNDRAV